MKSKDVCTVNFGCHRFELGLEHYQNYSQLKTVAANLDTGPKHFVTKPGTRREVWQVSLTRRPRDQMQIASASHQ